MLNRPCPLEGGLRRKPQHSAMISRAKLIIKRIKGFPAVTAFIYSCLTGISLTHLLSFQCEPGYVVDKSTLVILEVRRSLGS